MSLTQKKCTVCESGTLPLTLDQANAYQKELKTSWGLVDGKKIQRKFSFSDFKTAMVFVNQVATIAEEEGHHPDLHIFYNKVTIELWTHAAKGLTENDFIVAAKIEELPSIAS